MSYAIVPTLFDAIIAGKKTPKYDWHRSYTTVINQNHVEYPISIEIESTMHSFTVSFRFKDSGDGTIAGFISNNENHTISVLDSTIFCKELSISYPAHLKDWTHVVLSHSYANQKSMLFVNEELVGGVHEQLSPTQVHFGGTAQCTELKDIALHRSSLNESDVLDLFNKKFIQSSLEFYNPLTNSFEGNLITNHAQSLSTAVIDKNVEVRQNIVGF